MAAGQESTSTNGPIFYGCLIPYLLQIVCDLYLFEPACNCWVDIFSKMIMLKQNKFSF